MVPWDDGTKLVDDPSEDDVDVDEDALVNHRLCLRHLLSNCNRAMGNVQLKKLFGRTAEQRQHAKVIEGLRARGSFLD